MNRRPGAAILVIGFLAVLGLIVQLSRNPSSVLIPVILVGIVFLLWKYPPETWRRRTAGPVRMRRKSKADRNKAARRAKFRVIQGSKKQRNDEQPPGYH